MNSKTRQKLPFLLQASADWETLILEVTGLEACPKLMLSVGGSSVLERMTHKCFSCGLSKFALASDDSKVVVDEQIRVVEISRSVIPGTVPGKSTLRAGPFRNCRSATGL